MQQQPSNKIRNQIVLTFVLALLLVFGYSLFVFYFSTQARQIIQSSDGLANGVTQEHATIIEHTIEDISRVSFLFLSFGMVLFIWLMFNMMYSISPALKRITFAITEISKGNFNYRLKLPVNNELGELAIILNQALDKVMEGEKALVQEKGQVESLVDLRTRQLKIEKTKFLTSITSLPLGFILADHTGDVSMINPAMKKLLKIDETEQSSQHLRSIVGEDSFLHTLLSTAQHIYADQEVSSQEIKTSDGRYLNAFYSPLPKTDDSGGVVIVVEDVTEEKLLEHSKDEFFSIASHELRTPLAAIRGNASLIKELYEKNLSDEDFNTMITGIENSSTRLIAIVNDFLDASKLEQGKIQLKLQKMPLQSAISSVIEEISAIANEKSLYVEATIHSIESMPEVYADPERVEQVVYNLVGNALKFVEHGGVTIHAERQEKFVKVFITDTGSGISKENQQLLFRKFQQANIENKETNSVPGTGLGLYISKLLVENMGGVVALESSIEGKGSTFSFTLPIAE